MRAREIEAVCDRCLIAKPPGNNSSRLQLATTEYQPTGSSTRIYFIPLASAKVVGQTEGKESSRVFCAM